MKCLGLLFLCIYFKICIAEYDSEIPEVIETTHIRLFPNKLLKKDSNDVFSIFCYENVPKTVFQFWRSVQFSLVEKPKTFELYCATNATEVQLSYDSKSIWTPVFLYVSSQTIDFPAFSPYCAGVASSEKYSVFLQVRTINYWKALQTFLGFFIFLAAPTLSRNVFFHYTSGVLIGILSSLLILLYIISRFIPKKSASYAVLVFGYSFFLYIIQVLSQHFQDILGKHLDFVVGYCVISALFSFVICYRLGPIQNYRTLNLLQWSMQAFGLLLIFFSSEYREVSTAVILLLLSVMLIPTRWIKTGKHFWYRFSPPKVKLLTEVEYIEQGNVETKKALEDLKRFCNSPDCKVWRVVKRLKDPTRFANFIETGIHITDDELMEYNFEDFSDTIPEDTETLQVHMSNGVH